MSYYQNLVYNAFINTKKNDKSWEENFLNNITDIRKLNILEIVPNKVDLNFITYMNYLKQKKLNKYVISLSKLASINKLNFFDLIIINHTENITDLYKQILPYLTEEHIIIYIDGVLSSNNIIDILNASEITKFKIYILSKNNVKYDGSINNFIEKLRNENKLIA